MSNKTYAEHLDGELQNVLQDYLNYSDQELQSNAALIKRLKEQQAARRAAATALPNNESTTSQTTRKL